MHSHERQRLDNVARWYSSHDAFDRILIEFNVRTIAPSFRGPAVLEIGCADGEMTRYLVRAFRHVTALDASAQQTRAVRRKFGSRVEVVTSLVETYKPSRQFNTIIMAHLLEHVARPRAILRRAQRWIAPGGRLIIVVPNADSLHRLAAVKMGLLPMKTSLNARDHALGHRRVYSRRTLWQTVRGAGLHITREGGIFLKPLSNQQILTDWTRAMIEAYYELSLNFPSIASELFAVCVPARPQR